MATLGGAPFIFHVSMCECTIGVLIRTCRTMYIYATRIILIVMSMYEGPLENIQHLYLYGKVAY